MTSQKTHDPASAVNELRAAVEGFSRFIRELPEADQAEKAWGPREVLAHLVFWIESYVAQVESLLSGEPPELPQGRFSDLNVQAVEASRGVPVGELLRRFRAADERLRHFGRTLDPQRILLEVHWRRGTWLCTLDDVIAKIRTHVHRHHRELARQGTDSSVS